MTAASERGASTAGYSGKPLVKKLGIEVGSRLRVMAAPQDYRAWLRPVPQGAQIESRLGGTNYDIVHLFVRSMSELARDLPRARRMTKTDGAIWVSWPKKSSGVATDLSENAIRVFVLQTDLVDVKVCAVTEIWSGLKLVVRRHLR